MIDKRALVRTVLLAAVVVVAAVSAKGADMRASVDPVSRLIHLVYDVPSTAPDPVTVRCEWAPRGSRQWRPARVEPLLSLTARELLRKSDWDGWIKGEVRERRAAGLERTLVFNPYPDAQTDGIVNCDVRVRITDDQGTLLAEQQTRVEADNSDVVILDDWTQVMQKQVVSESRQEGLWHIQTGLAQDESPYAAGGDRLYGPGGVDLPQLTYPLDLNGRYAIFVCAYGGVKLRMTGDEHYDNLGSGIPAHEQLWSWRQMDWQHLVIRQNYAFTGPAATTLDYIRLVPLTAEQYEELEERFRGRSDKLVASYWEPYSYAFSDNVQDVFWHREYLQAYRQADVSIVDTQLGRFGAKVVFESRVSDQLLYQTRGDPIGAIKHPTTTNVGRMQQYTNTLMNSLRFGRELGLTVHANFGASNCYPGSPLQGDFSKQHPDWMRGSALRFEVPEVRQFVLALYRESLAIGAPGVSIDFCRYPETIDATETCNTFFRELRQLADEFAEARGEPVTILTRFPAHGVRRSEFFDYATWAREGWVDIICPSNIQGRYHYFDIEPYQKAVAGTSCRLLPQIDALSWGLAMPGLFLGRVADLYDRGVPGIYIYQGDALIARDPIMRRYVRMMRSSDKVREYWERDRRRRTTHSKGIYLTRFNQLPGYHHWERIHIWLEGIPMGPVEVFLDDTLLNRFEGPPYLVGSQTHEGDDALPRGEHVLCVRARDGDGWLEKTFDIVSGG